MEKQVIISMEEYQNLLALEKELTIQTGVIFRNDYGTYYITTEFAAKMDYDNMLKDRNNILEERNKQLINEKAELIRELKKYKNKENKKNWIKRIFNL